MSDRYSKSKPRVKSWRDSANYRKEYFEKNKGLFGCIWFCSQCGKPLWGQNSVQVDHIIPPSKLSKKKYKKGVLVKNTSILARAMNSEFNTVACCADCNRKKSDKMGLYTVKGFGAKIGEKTVFGISTLMAKTAYLAATVAHKVLIPKTTIHFALLVVVIVVLVVVLRIT